MATTPILVRILLWSIACCHLSKMFATLRDMYMLRFTLHVYKILTLGVNLLNFSAFIAGRTLIYYKKSKEVPSTPNMIMITLRSLNHITTTKVTRASHRHTCHCSPTGADLTLLTTTNKSSCICLYVPISQSQSWRNLTLQSIWFPNTKTATHVDEIHQSKRSAIREFSTPINATGKFAVDEVDEETGYLILVLCSASKTSLSVDQTLSQAWFDVPNPSCQRRSKHMRPWPIDFGLKTIKTGWMTIAS
jgi:hypothetical protein